MGMNTHISGFKPPDEKWKKMKAVMDACLRAGIPCPEEVRDFFGPEEPDKAGVLVPQEQLGLVQRHRQRLHPPPGHLLGHLLRLLSAVHLPPIAGV